MSRSIGQLALVSIWLIVPSAAFAAEIPAGTIVHARLDQLLSSFGSKTDTPISATVIAPVEAGGQILVPLDADLLGHVQGVRRVGLGLSRETAYLQLVFDRLRLPDGTVIPISARVAEVDNSRETVDRNGRIHGIRATASFASMLSGFAVSLGALDPMLLAFTTSTSLSVFRIPESEVIFPAGTELRVRLLEPVTLASSQGPLAPEIPGSDDASSALAQLVRGLPFRTATEKTHIPSDLTNLLLLGSERAVRQAFDAAGWGITDPLTSKSTYATLRAVVENQGYREAPMSTLLLNGTAPVATYAKTLNTFFTRHHARVFGGFGSFDGVAVWTSSSTHDSGIGFATRSKAFIHVIDQNIDEERNKVVYDLLLTGCADAVSLVDRPWVPRDALNATGDALITDGRIAVIRLNACDAPVRADVARSAGDAVRAAPSAVERVFRNTALWLKNDAFRGNVVYQGYAGARLGFNTLFRKKSEVSERAIKYGGEEFKIVPGGQAAKHDLAPDDPGQTQPAFYPVSAPRRTAASVLEFSVSGGYTGFGNDAFSTQEIDLLLPPGLLSVSTLPIAAVTELQPRAAFSIKTTINTSRHVSHEVGYTVNRTVFTTRLTELLSAATDVTAPAHIRQFDYNVLVHFRPNGWRVRPYAAVGPGLQVIRIGSAAENPRGGLRLPFKSASVLEGTWSIGSDPPLEGGGILQVALQYGAGIKLFASPHWVVRADFRETLSEQPDFWTKSYPALRAASDPGGITFEPGRLTTHGPLRHRLFSVGVGVAF